MIGLELKQKREEHTGKKWRGEERRGVLSARGRSEQ